MVKIPKFIPKGQINNNPALIQVIVRPPISDKPLSEPTLTGFTNV